MPDQPSEEARAAARDAVVREYREMFHVAQRALGSDPLAYAVLSDRTKRIQHNQLDPLADAALAAAYPLLRQQTPTPTTLHPTPTSRRHASSGRNGRRSSVPLRPSFVPSPETWRPTSD